MAVKVYVQEDDQIKISGELFDLKPLPSEKALNFRKMLQDINLEKALEDISEGLSPDMPLTDELIKIGENIGDKFRYGLISYALQIEEGSEEYTRLTKAIDKAGFKEIWWVVQEIIDVNGFKWLEKMIKNLVEALTPNLQELGQSASRLLKKYSEKNEIVKNLDERLKEIRSSGSNSLYQDSQESRTTSIQPESVAS